jgi:hypothetical protein
MKNGKYFPILCLFCLLGAGFLGAQDSGGKSGYWRMPDRLVEFGVDMEGGFGNSLLRVKDIFNFRKTLLVNFSTISPGKLYFDSKAAVSTFVNVNVIKDLGRIDSMNFGVFAGAEIDAYLSAREEFTRLLRYGNAGARSTDAEMSAGASVFVDTGIRADAGIGKFRFTVKPAAFSPLLYIPPPDMYAAFSTTDTGIDFAALANIDIYSAFSLEGLFGEGGGETGKLDIPLGFDISLEGTYAILPSLDLGLTIDHIPLYPAELHYRTRQEFSMKGGWANIYDTLTQGDFDFPEPETRQIFTDNASFKAFRPLRADFFVEYRPAVADVLVLRPNLGLSALTIFGYDTVCVNAGLEVQLNIINMFSFSMGTGYEERLWKHSLGFRMNFRAIELNARLAIWGPDIINSFRGKGLGAGLGIRMGF